MEGEIAAAAAQFGVAGMVCWMWLFERRAAGARERQLTESHERIARNQREIDVLVAALGENTRALTALEAGQRGLVAMLERLADGRGGRVAG
jgi:hypothetical protein